jgi:hypothetical protein
MRQVMSHRNNIGLRRIKCKKYFTTRWTNGLQKRQTLTAVRLSPAPKSKFKMQNLLINQHTKLVTRRSIFPTV